MEATIIRKTMVHGIQHALWNNGCMTIGDDHSINGLTDEYEIRNIETNDIMEYPEQERDKIIFDSLTTGTESGAVRDKDGTIVYAQPV